jgi:salicylate hydroxylase
VQNAAQRNAWAYHLRMPIFRDAAHMILRRSNGEKMLAKYDWLYGYDVTRDS